MPTLEDIVAGSMKRLLLDRPSDLHRHLHRNGVKVSLQTVINWTRGGTIAQRFQVDVAKALDVDLGSLAAASARVAGGDAKVAGIEEAMPEICATAVSSATSAA